MSVLICGHETRIFKVTRSEFVIEYIVNAERATFKDGSIIWKKSKDSIGLNSNALLKIHPEYLE